MKIIERGHIYMLQTLDKTERDTCDAHIRFVNRERGAEHPGTQTQELLRALIDRTMHCDNCIPWDSNIQIIHHMRMAIAYHEARALERKVYIGKTEKTLKERWGEHLRDSSRGHRRYLYYALRKYGPENFSISPLMRIISLQDLDKSEIRHIKAFKSTDPRYGYNMTVGGDGVMSGRHHSRKTRLRQSRALKGNKNALGHRHSKKWRAEQSRRMMGKHNNPSFGLYFSPEWRRAQSQRMMGNRNGIKRRYL
jgi:group I intron endonuclease